MRNEWGWCQQCDQIWRNSTTLANIEKSLAIYLRFIWFWAKSFLLTWHNLYAFGQIFIVVNGQILKTQSGHLVTLVVCWRGAVRPGGSIENWTNIHKVTKNVANVKFYPLNDLFYVYRENE